MTGRHFDVTARASTYVGREWELAKAIEAGYEGHIDKAKAMP